jgi:DNA-directed RNA polymerase subunit D
LQKERRKKRTKSLKPKMEIKSIQKKKDRIMFSISGISVAFANTLRRTIMDEVPTMAIEDVEMRKNSSVLYDEIVAHRLGLVPLKTDLKTYNLPSKCTCKGELCAKCSVQISLKSKATANESIVMASEIKSKDPAIKPAFTEMPIVKLLKNQEIEFEAIAVLGQGKDHVKWTPAHVFYRYYPVIEIKKQPDDAEKVKKSCPSDVFEVKAGKLNVKDIESCTLCGACSDVFDGIKIGEKNDEFIFFVESFGQLEPKEIVVKAIEMIDENLDEFAEQFK